VLGASIKQFIAMANTDASRVRAVREQLGIDPRDPAAVARLLLGHALHANAAGVVLFSTSKPANIDTALGATAVTADAAARLDALVRTWVDAGAP
jgi:hypothetical protein